VARWLGTGLALPACEVDGANDLIAADEGFNFTGQLQATLSDASEHATHVREQLIEIQRKGSE
jgi:hypothetical protein